MDFVSVILQMTAEVFRSFIIKKLNFQRFTYFLYKNLKREIFIPFSSDVRSVALL